MTICKRNLHHCAKIANLHISGWKSWNILLSSRTHPTSIPSLQHDRLKISTKNPGVFSPDSWAHWTTCHEIRVTLSPSIQWENRSLNKGKSWRKGRYEEQGHSRRCRLQEHRELRKNPFENKMLVWLSLLPINASHKQDCGRQGAILGYQLHLQVNTGNRGEEVNIIDWKR